MSFMKELQPDGYFALVYFRCDFKYDMFSQERADELSVYVQELLEKQDTLGFTHIKEPILTTGCVVVRYESSAERTAGKALLTDLACVKEVRDIFKVEA